MQFFHGFEQHAELIDGRLTTDFEVKADGALTIRQSRGSVVERSAPTRLTMTTANGEEVEKVGEWLAHLPDLGDPAVGTHSIFAEGVHRLTRVAAIITPRPTLSAGIADTLERFDAGMRRAQETHTNRPPSDLRPLEQRSQEAGLGPFPGNVALYAEHQEGELNLYTDDIRSVPLVMARQLGDWILEGYRSA